MKLLSVFVIALAGIVAPALLSAYPTMWFINYVFAPSLLLSVFGVSKLAFWQAFGLNILLGWLGGSKSSYKPESE
jgi:hypothetical protein